MTEAAFTWTGVQQRPFAPCHLRAKRLGDGTMRFSWIRRARIGGDPWLSGEVPLGEAEERYRLDILHGPALVRSIEAASPAIDYSPAAQVADFPSGLPQELAVEVRQFSAAFGWWPPIRRDALGVSPAS